MALFTEQHPGVEPHAPQETAGFTLNHSMLRVKDPDGCWIEIVEPALMANTGV
ncbi:hypothetical protein [Modicisalibacter zincidurans]|uniref:Lactoylglutathione lyase n=1 Tax=Modicisalibacter zincidurans TaxID=1178777 RepID=A0ABP9RGF7_9GAMM